MNTVILEVAARWRKALSNKKFNASFALSLFALVLCAIAAPYIFAYIQKRSGILLNDFILDLIPPYDLSIWIFIVLYALIGIAVIYLVLYPGLLLMSVQGYVLLTVFRFITLLLTPLEQPHRLIAIDDPILDQFFYKQPVTKDLFFSGHTAILFLLALIVENRFLKLILAAGGIAMGLMVIIQHAHYTIDVIAAPVFAWIAYRLTKHMRTRLA